HGHAVHANQGGGLGGLAAEVEFLDRCGTPGMVWPQLFGETYQLTKEERLRGMGVIARAANGRRPAVVLGVQGPSTAAALEYLEHAESLDHDALIALPPDDAKTVDDIVTYYSALGRAATRPLFIQNADTGSGLKPGIDVLLELTRECPNCG